MTLPVKVAGWISKGRWRLYVLFLLLMILPIAFFAYSAGRVLKHQAETQAVTESTQIAHVAAALVEEHFRQSTAFLESIATRPSFRKAWMEGDQQMVERNLTQAHGLRPDFVFVSAYDLYGTMRAIYPPQPTLLSQNFAYRDWYKGVARQWNPYISEVYQTAVAPYQLVVAIVVPVRDDAGKPIGILMAPRALDTMSRQLVETKLEGGWTISLVDQNGHLSAHPNIDSYAAPVDLSGYGPVKQLRASQSGHGTFVRDGNSFFTRYEPVEPYGWGVLVEQPSAALQQGVQAIERSVWLFGLVFRWRRPGGEHLHGVTLFQAGDGQPIYRPLGRHVLYRWFRWIFQEPEPVLANGTGIYHGRAHGEALPGVHTSGGSPGHGG